MTSSFVRLLAALAVCCSVSGCFLFGGNTNKDPLKDRTVTVRWYEGDTLNTLPDGETAVTMKSNRDFYLNAGDSNDLTKVEVTRTIGGVATTCTLTNDDGSLSTADVDWPGSNTDYTVTLSTEASSKTFGPFTVTVQAPSVVVTGSESISDQGVNNDDAPCFFQTRHLGWGTTANNATWQGYLVRSNGARIVDFAALTVGGAFKVVSPDKIQSTFNFPKMARMCGWLTTTFEVYTGPLDPALNPKPTLAEVQALPNPPATATSLDLSANQKFVYRTSDGKKGLIKVVGAINTDASGSKSATLAWASEQ
jgi:hypothetical protein